MKTMPAAEFKAKCLKLMDEVNRKNVEIIITKHGRPTAKLVPMNTPVARLFGSGKGTVKILGDIINSPKVKWNAES